VQRTTTCNGQQTTDNTQQTTDNRQQTACNGQLIKNAGRHATKQAPVALEGLSLPEHLAGASIARAQSYPIGMLRVARRLLRVARRLLRVARRLLRVARRLLRVARRLLRVARRLLRVARCLLHVARYNARRLLHTHAPAGVREGGRRRGRRVLKDQCLQGCSTGAGGGRNRCQALRCTAWRTRGRARPSPAAQHSTAQHSTALHHPKRDMRSTTELQHSRPSSQHSATELQRRATGRVRTATADPSARSRSDRIR
jgi:hypothetical protein